MKTLLLAAAAALVAAIASPACAQSDWADQQQFLAQQQFNNQMLLQQQQAQQNMQQRQQMQFDWGARCAARGYKNATDRNEQRRRQADPARRRAPHSRLYHDPPTRRARRRDPVRRDARRSSGIPTADPISLNETAGQASAKMITRVGQDTGEAWGRKPPFSFDTPKPSWPPLRPMTPDELKAARTTLGLTQATASRARSTLRFSAASPPIRSATPEAASGSGAA
jgi:hypothetical protein